MNSTRKERVKQKLAERRRFYDALAKTKKAEYVLQRLQRRNQNGVLVTFLFNPDELGVPVVPTQEAILGLGLERALSRLDRRDFYKHVTTRVNGNVGKQALNEVRKSVLAQLLAKSAPKIDLSTLTTAGQGDSNEVESE